MAQTGSIFESIQEAIPPIHKEGYIFVIIFSLITVLLFAFTIESLGWVAFMCTLWCAYFFRDPERFVPAAEGLIVSPADGIVSEIVENAAPPPELEANEEGYTRVSVFLNVFNVHINRTPIQGEVIRKEYHPGQFLNASLDKASDLNERMGYIIKTNDGLEIPCVQIAGLVARRIKSFVNKGQHLQTGERFGLIRFGSRTDVYLPKGVSPQVAIGQVMIGGETIIADLTNPSAQLSVRKD